MNLSLFTFDVKPRQTKLIPVTRDTTETRKNCIGQASLLQASTTRSDVFADFRSRHNRISTASHLRHTSIWSKIPFQSTEADEVPWFSLSVVRQSEKYSLVRPTSRSSISLERMAEKSRIRAGYRLLINLAAEVFELRTWGRLELSGELRALSSELRLRGGTNSLGGSGFAAGGNGCCHM